MIYIFLAEGFEEIEALTPLDILRRAGLPVYTVAIADNAFVEGAHGIRISADKMYKDIDPEDSMLAIFPGGMPGAKNLNEWEACDEIITKTIENGGRLAAICAAPLILGMRGLLNGKNAACYPGFEDKLIGARVLNTPVVTDDNITTSRGMGTAVDFSLELVKLLSGEEKAAEIKKAILKD